mgnify:FL=1
MSPEDQTISLSGWVRTKRDSKNITFFELNDGSCLANIQVIFDRTANEGGLVGALDAVQTGAAVDVTGTLVASPGKGQSVEIHGTDVTVVGAAPADTYPL